MSHSKSEHISNDSAGSAWLRITLLAIVSVSLLAHLLATLQPVFSDEYLVFRNFRDFVQNRTLIPQHTQYPSLFSYMVAPVNAAFFGASVALGLPPSIPDFLRWTALQPELAMWPARLVSLICWGVTAWVVFLLALETIGSRRLAAIAGAGFASAYGLLEYSGYGLPDVAMMMWATLALLYALRLMRGNHPIRDAAIAGGLAGLAMATKYSAIAVVAPLLAAVLLAETQDRRLRLRMLGTMAGVGVAAFIAGCPGWIVAPEDYWWGLQFERAHMARGHLGFFGVPILGQLELLSVDPVLLIGGITGGVVWGTRCASRQLILLAIAGAAVLAMAAPAKKQSLQYIFAIYPILAILLAGGLAHLASRLRRPLTLLVLVGLLLTAAWGLLWGYRVALFPDSLVVGRQWINAQMPEDAVVAVDWIGVPRLISESELAELREGLRTEMVRAAYEGLRGFETVGLPPDDMAYWTRDFLATTRATWLVTSSAGYERFFEFGRFTRLPPPEGAELRGEFVQKRDFYQALRDGYAGWELEHEVFTGNGPTVQIYRRGVPN